MPHRLQGGGQERGMRSGTWRSVVRYVAVLLCWLQMPGFLRGTGTLATPLVVGLGEACRVAKEEMVVSGRSCQSCYLL